MDTTKPIQIKAKIKFGKAGSKEMSYQACYFHSPKYTEDEITVIYDYNIFEIIYGYTSNKLSVCICERCLDEVYGISEIIKNNQQYYSTI